MKTFPRVLIFLLANLAFGQVKIGDNINTIDQSSLVELESNSKVFVVTRVSASQMNAITPLNGALVYNTDDNCLFQFRNNTWVSLCVDIVGGQTITTLIDNLDGTFTYTNESGNDAILTKAGLVDNNDGSYSFSNGSGLVSIQTSAISNSYNNTSSGLGATNVQTAIDELKSQTDAAITATADDDITGASLDGASLLTIEEGTSSVDVSLAALEESADITAEETRALAAEAAIQADVDQNEADADAAILAEEARALAAEAVIQADVDQNETDANAAIALKEDTANKSTDITLADATNTLFPTELAVKTYVDGQIAATADDDITAASLDGASLLTIEEGTSSVDVSLAALEESADITAEETRALAAEAVIQADVDQNETDADAAILAEETRALAAEAVIQADVDQNETDADAAIATNLASITNHIALDNDLSDTNEDQTVTAGTGISVVQNGDDFTVANTAPDQTVTIVDGGGGNVTVGGTYPNFTLEVPDTSVSGTEGSVFFAATNGSATENNSQLFWDATENRLGIGTDTPSHKLQVNGQVRATSFANANGTAGAPSYRFNNDANSGMYSADSDQLGFSTGGTEALRINDAQSVGVGDFSSGTIDASLHVKSTGVPLKIEPSPTTPAGTSGGQMFVANDDGILYIFDGTRNKWLSVTRTMIGWGRNSGNTTNEYLRQFNGALSSDNGWRMVRDGTITAITAQSNINQTWTLEIRKNDAVGVITTLIMTNVQGNEDGTINVDVNKGDFLQAFCNGSSIDFPEALIEIAWRK